MRASPTVPIGPQGVSSNDLLGTASMEPCARCADWHRGLTPDPPFLSNRAAAIWHILPDRKATAGLWLSSVSRQPERGGPPIQRLQAVSCGTAAPEPSQKWTAVRDGALYPIGPLRPLMLATGFRAGRSAPVWTTAGVKAIAFRPGIAGGRSQFMFRSCLDSSADWQGNRPQSSVASLRHERVWTSEPYPYFLTNNNRPFVDPEAQRAVCLPGKGRARAAARGPIQRPCVPMLLL